MTYVLRSNPVLTDLSDQKQLNELNDFLKQLGDAVRSAFIIVPVYSTPVEPEANELFINSDTGKLTIYLNGSFTEIV